MICETQLRRLEQFLVYCDDSKQELETVNLACATKHSRDFHRAAGRRHQRHDRTRCGAADHEGNPRACAWKRLRPPAPKSRAGSTPITRAIPDNDRKRINNDG